VIVLVVWIHVRIGSSFGGLSSGGHVQRDSWVKAARPARYASALDARHYNQ
jgi:hypothetical protein